MATERRYLKGDTVEVVNFPNLDMNGERFMVRTQRVENGVVSAVAAEGFGCKFYAHQVKLVKRPWWNWLRLPFVKKVNAYQRSMAR